MEITRYIHDKILNHLLEKNDKDPDFLFRLRRSNRYNRLSKGFWFHGNENYLALSFWSGSDWKNKTPNISFIFSKDGSLYLELSAKDSTVKTSFFYKKFQKADKSFELVGDDEYLHSEDFKNDGLGMKFKKKLDFKWDYNNLEHILETIINVHKTEIDAQINEWYKTEPIQGSNRLGLIDKADFVKLRKRIIKYQEELRANELLLNPFSMTTETVIYKYLEGNYSHELNKKLDNILNKTPVSLNYIEIVNYKELRNIKIQNIPENIQWIFITGENGTGKSSLLEAIVLGLNGNMDNNLVLNSNKFKIKLKVNKGSEEIFNNVTQNTFFEEKDFKKINNFVCYGPNRFDISSTPSTTAIDHTGKTYNLFNGDGKLLNIEEALIKWELKADLFDYHNSFTDGNKADESNPYSYYEKYFDIFSQIKEIFIGKGEGTDNYTPGLLPSVVDMSSDRVKDDDRIYYATSSKSNGEKVQKLFHELSTGNKSLVAMIGDLILRFIEKDEIDNSFEFPDPTEFEGIVLIDEIDAHIHPKWQMEIPKLLSEIFPRIQFIVTCHSPIPFMGIPDKERSLFVKLKRDKGMCLVADQLDYLDLYDLMPETILSSPLFDFDPLYDQRDPELRMTTEKDYSEEVFNRILKTKLNKLAEEIRNKKQE